MSDEQDRQRERDEQEWQSKRDDLLDRVKRGELTGEEADAEAEKLGPAPRSKRPARFSTRPADDEFRPERMGEWTLTMALAWILYGDLDEVREWHAPYLAECRRWGHTDAGGWELKPPHAPTFVLLLTSVAMGRVGVNGSKASMSGREAEEQLWAMLQGGKLKATGIDTTTSTSRAKRPVKIPAREWRELKLVVPDVQGPGKVDEVRRGRGLGEGYRDVLVRSADVRSYFLAPGEKPILTETKAEAPTPEEQPKHRGGRTLKYDWTA